VGASATDEDDRPNVVKVARQRVETADGVRLGPESAVLIGDTENDAAAARHGAARIIAIATGSDTADDLAKAGAGTMFNDLTQTDDLLTAIYADQLRT
jgi:phosphoglycolate phosphatase-like HAD superfamily hydrolase